MRYVIRPSKPPDVLNAPEFRKMREEYLAFLSLDERERAQTRPPDRHLPSRYAGSTGPLMDALNEVFGGRCAFCESPGVLRPYRFRPTSFAEPATEPEPGKEPHDHLAYGWLADVWENLYPICRDCEPDRPSWFPVEDRRSPVPTASRYAKYILDVNNSIAEGLILTKSEKFSRDDCMFLDPCRDDSFYDHFDANEDGELIGKTRKAVLTIDHFKLNRQKLIEQRRFNLRKYFYFGVRKNIKFIEYRLKRIEKASLYEGFLRLFLFSRAHLRHNTFRTAIEKSESGSTVLASEAKTITPTYSLRDVTLTNYKAHEHLKFSLPTASLPDGPTPSLLILGENAAGKSSILEAIALAVVDDKTRRALKEKPSTILLDPAQMGSTGVPREQAQKGSVELGFHAPSGEEARRTLQITPHRFRLSGPQEGLPPVFAYGAYRHFKKDFHDPSPEQPIVSLFQSDHLLSNPERWLIGLDDRAFNAVIAALRDIFGPSGGFSYIERRERRSASGQTETYCVVVASAKAGDSTKGSSTDPVTTPAATPLHAVSSGFRTVLALACDAIRWMMGDRKEGWGLSELRQSRAIILIDEVEAHLHPRWKVQIMDGLRKALPSVTFIVTSHDPLCLRGMRDGEVMVLRRMPGEKADTQLPVKVEQLTQLPNVSKLTIEQLLKSEFFALFDTDDPRSGSSMAELAAALAGAPGEQADALRQTFRREIDDALPPYVGNSEVSRLVHDAVAKFIRDSMTTPDSQRPKLRMKVKRRIVSVLKRALDA